MVQKFSSGDLCLNVRDIFHRWADLVRSEMEKPVLARIRQHREQAG
jgi:hypothetical protein